MLSGLSGQTRSSGSSLEFFLYIVMYNISISLIAVSLLSVLK